MEKIVKLVRGLYQRGEITFGEAAALTGAVWTVRDSGEENIRKFAEQYGKFGVAGLETLQDDVGE
jgi:hypothetical protein